MTSIEGSPLTSNSDDEKRKSRSRSRRRCCCLPVPGGVSGREPAFPLKIRLFYFFLNTAFRAVARRDGTLAVNRKLFSFLGLTAPPRPTPDSAGVATSDHVVDPARNLFVRHFQPSLPPTPAPTRLPVIVYFHGGGFVSGSAVDRQMDTFCRRVAGRIPAHVVSVEYRLAPEHRFPAPYDDGADVLRWLDGGGLEGLDLSAVFLAGDSAGGNIAHHVARRAAAEAYGGLRVVGVVAIQPFFGGEEETESERRTPFVSRKYVRLAWRAFLPEGSSLDHEAANVSGPGSLLSSSSSSSSEEWRGFPETMVVIGEWDPFRDRQRWYCDALRRAGVRVCQAEYAHAVHAFFVFDKSQRERLIDEVREFVRSRCADQEARAIE